MLLLATSSSKRLEKDAVFDANTALQFRTRPICNDRREREQMNLVSLEQQQCRWFR